MENQENLSPAEKMYKSHLKNVSNYQKRNPDKMKEKCKKYSDKIKNDPEKYKKMLEKKKEYYLNVKKPKLEALKLKEINDEKNKNI
jgi:hypothetical protein